MSQVNNKSQHFAEERKKREQFIINTIGLGEDLNVFEEIDKKYGNPVLHITTDTGVYKIVTKDTNYLITMWIARPQQLKDLYKRHHTELPKWLLQKAIDHKQMGYCYIGENNPHNHYAHKNTAEKTKDIMRKSQRKQKVIY
jgi:hypothetical protein